MTASKIAQYPKCVVFGKQTVCSTPGSTSFVEHGQAGILCAGSLLPGSEVSVDHLSVV